MFHVFPELQLVVAVVFQKPFDVIFQVFPAYGIVVQIARHPFHSRVDAVKSRKWLGQPLVNHLHIFGIQFDSDGVAGRLLANP